jgi:hypothetical protein
LHGLVPSAFVVDGTTIGLLVILVVVALVPILRSASLPGGAGLEFDLDRLRQESQLAEDEQEEHEISTSGDGPAPPDVEEEVLEERLQSADAVVAEVLREAARSPKVGLMVLSAELDRAVRELLLGTGWGLPGRRLSLSAGVERLVDLGTLSTSAASALNVFQTIRNKIIHGSRGVSDDEVVRAIDAAIPLLRAILAVPMERHFVEAAGVPVFSDVAATIPIDDATGVVLKTTSPEGLERHVRMFPTTRTGYYEKGKRVTWEWGEGGWGPAWYRDPDSGEVKGAWVGSMEFAGRHFDEL